MRGQVIIAPSKRQRWGVVLIALVVAGVVVTRGGTPQPAQAEHPQPSHQDLDAIAQEREQRLDSQKHELDDSHVPTVASMPQ